MKQLVSLISRCVFVGALLILAPDHVPPPAHTPMTAPAPPSTRARTTPMLYTHTLRGASVRTPDGISLGVLDDLVLDPADALIVMVIVVAAGGLALAAGLSRCRGGWCSRWRMRRLSSCYSHRRRSVSHKPRRDWKRRQIKEP
jgi:hypothetical protein